MRKKKKNRRHVLRELLHSPRFRYGSLSTLLLCLALALILGLNLIFSTLEEKNAWRLDYSFNAQTTYGEVTETVLAQLTHPVHIYALYDRGEEDQPLLELLNRYAAASPLVTWEQTSISLNPGLLTKFRSSTSDDTTLTNDSIVVYCEATDRWKILSALDFYSLSYNYDEGVYEYAGTTYESSLTSAIRYVSQDTVPRIMILQGHGELDEDGTAALAQLLSSNHYDVYYFTFSSEEADLQPEDLLMILSPVRDFTDAELETITAFTDAGGSIFFTCDYSDPLSSMPNYTALLRSYGFLPQNGMVIASDEEPNTYYNNNRTFLIPTMQSTSITSDLVDALDTFLVLTGSRAFSIPQESDRNLTTEAVLTTSDKSYLRDFSSGSLSLNKQEDDASGPFALALQASRFTDTGDLTRAFVLGSSTLLTSTDEYSMTVSQEFIIRCVEYLLNSDHVDLNILAKVAVRPALSANSITLGTVIIILLPVSVLAAALFVLLRRKNK